MLHGQIDWSDSASVARMWDYLWQKLRRHFGDDEQLLEDSIADALAHYKRHPESFDASRGSLLCYLWWRARHYLDKQLQKEQCHRKHEKAVGVSDTIFEKIVSEVGLRGGIYIGKDKSEQEVEEREEELGRWRGIFNAVTTRLNPHDQEGVQLLRDGASLEEWVRHLGIESLPESEQRRKVNAEKDRLKKLLKRWAQKIQGG